MTDEQIIKAYERCFTLGFDESTCYECPFYTATAKCTEDLRDSVLDLINRQKAKIENEINQIKSEAIKEFAKRLKEKCYEDFQETYEMLSPYVTDDDIDDLVKEMTEEK